jgi:hypothetical protein
MVQLRGAEAFTLRYQYCECLVGEAERRQASSGFL